MYATWFDIAADIFWDQLLLGQSLKKMVGGYMAPKNSPMNSRFWHTIIGRYFVLQFALVKSSDHLQFLSKSMIFFLASLLLQISYYAVCWGAFIWKYFLYMLLIKHK